MNTRSAILGALSSTLVFSLICSVSMRYGHADTQVAKSAELIEPLTIGQKAPRFTVETVGHEPFAFDPQNLERPVLLISFRGGWCPYCNMHLSELYDVIPQIAALGIDVLFLSGDRPDLLYESLSRETQETIEGLDYRILSDADAQAARAFGVAFEAASKTIARLHERGDDIEESSMLRHGILPVPSVFAIDADGVIAFGYANPDYKVRLPADELLDVAAKLTGPK